MTLHFGDRTPGDGMLRCTRCGHGIALLQGQVVPRCYCGGDEFDQGSVGNRAGRDGAWRTQYGGRPGPRDDIDSWRKASG